MGMKQLHHEISVPVHRHTIVLRSDDARVTGAVADWVDGDIARRCAALGGNETSPMEIELLAGSVPAGFCASPSRPATATFEDVEFHSGASGTTLVFGGASRVDVHFGRRQARGFVSAAHIASPWTISHRIFYVPVLEILRSAGTFHIHAGCVCRGDRCILLCGASGRGKSTLTYALARAGFAYMSDDAAFIRSDGRAIEIFAFPEKIKLDRGSREFFPEFDGFPRGPGKMEIPASRTRIADVAVSGRPDAIVFTQRGSGGKSRLAPLSAGEAFLRLIGQSVSISRKDSVEANLDMLKRLAGASRSFELVLGHGFDGVPELVREALGD